MEQDVLHFYQQFAPRVQRKLYIGYDRVWVAQWAAFYDLLGIPYRYKPEAEDDPTVAHFWLPDQAMYVRVVEFDGTLPDEDGLYERYDHPDHHSHLYMCGPVVDHHAAPVESCPEKYRAEYWANLFVPEGFAVRVGYSGSDVLVPAGNTMTDNFHVWCECPECGKLGIEYYGQTQRLCRHRACGHPAAALTPRLLAAYSAAAEVRTVGALKPSGTLTMG